MSRIIHDAARHVFRREDFLPGIAIETDDTCTVCGQPSDEPILCSTCSELAARTCCWCDELDCDGECLPPPPPSVAAEGDEPW